MPRIWQRSGARVLGSDQAAVVQAALEADPVAGCMIAERFETYGIDPRALGGNFWGVDGGREALAFVGGNLLPLAATGPEALRRLAEGLAHRSRTVASLVGRSALVLPLWEDLGSAWGPAREVRTVQPLLTCPRPPLVDPDLRLRRMTAQLGDHYFPAAVAMFTEEVGIDPRAGDGGRSYRARVDDLIRRGLAFAVLDGAEVIFKAEIGALSSRVALIQGVWMAPVHRGRGLAAAAVAALVQHIQRDLHRLPSLYVNERNVTARRVYERVGFQQAGQFSSVLF
ncbi:MAG: GNAT family N-acetyltransferase [Nakamurella sp.]